MDIVVKTNTWPDNKGFNVSVPSADCSVAEALAEIRRQLPPPLPLVLYGSENWGSTVFLSLTPTEPERLVETRRLDDYSIKEGSTLWLWCAHLPSDRT